MTHRVEIGFLARTSSKLGTDGSLGWNTPAGRVAERLPLERRKQVTDMNSGRISALGMLVCAVAKLDRQADVKVYDRQGPVAITEPMRRGTFEEDSGLYVTVSMPKDLYDDPDDQDLAGLPVDFFAAMHNVPVENVHFAHANGYPMLRTAEQYAARFILHTR